MTRKVLLGVVLVASLLGAVVALWVAWRRAQGPTLLAAAVAPDEPPASAAVDTWLHPVPGPLSLTPEQAAQVARMQALSDAARVS